ncbi:hypothetical protein ACXU40_08620 [Bordetella bronchiseptica]|uniref:hypothetical protein n=1 Tax=Bordetella bronchiseptica TaxID=518 RepID=UPI001267A028|nr:hypothetical protein [Bordetella bronchiseptica]
MDDIQEKTRRNLVVYSSGILAIQFLGIPFNGHLLGVAKLDQVDPTHAWICALIVLAYLWLRYRYAPQNMVGIRKHDKIVAETATAPLVNRIREQFLRVLTGQRPAGVRFSEVEHPPGVTGVRPTNTSITWQTDRRGAIQSIWEATHASPNLVGTTGVSRAKFVVPWPSAVLARCTRTLRRYQLSWEMLEYRIPALLANAAGVVCVLQIAKLLP